MILKEDLNPTHFDTKSSVWKADSLNFESKEKHLLSFSKRDDSHLTFEVKCGEIYPDPKGVDENSMDNEIKVGDTRRKESLNECPDHASGQDICITSLDLFDAETNMYPDKNDLRPNFSSLIVSQAEINHQVVKDICIDSGVEMEDKFLIECCEDDNKNCMVSGWGNRKFSTSVGLKDMPLENIKCADEVDFESKQESSGNIIAQERVKLSMEICDKDISKKSNLEGVEHQIDETNSGPTGKTVTGDLTVDSVVDRTSGHPLGTLESKEKNDNELLHQETAKAGTCESLAELLEREPKEDRHVRSILYDSKVESGTITFNFDSLAESSEQSEDDQEVSTVVDLLDSGQVDWNNRIETNVSSKNDENEGISGNASNLDDDKNSANTSVANRLQHDDAGGASSFNAAAAASLIDNPSNLSFRSDGSTASATSFAFPVLQSEWNSSPVRMAKADRRDFRKRRGWRSGLLCCRF